MNPSAKPLLVFAAALVAVVIVQQLFFVPPAGPPHVPLPLPELLTQGWVNADTPPSRESLLGNWVVLDLWSLNCGPCRAQTPRLVKLYESLAGRGDVVLLGLNTDMSNTAEQIAEYTEGVPGYDWPVGHGAGVMSEVLDAPYWPTLILFAPDGQSVWRGHRVADLTQELDARLDLGQQLTER